MQIKLHSNLLVMLIWTLSLIFVIPFFLDNSIIGLKPSTQISLLILIIILIAIQFTRKNDLDYIACIFLNVGLGIVLLCLLLTYTFEISRISTLTSTPAPIISGNINYVAKNGDDNNPGTENQPWLTLAKAGNTAVAGDIVYVKEGQYNEKLFVRNSGEVGKYLTFTVYPGDEVSIDGTGVMPIGYLTPYDALIYMPNNDYIIIDGFNFKNVPQSGIRLVNGNNVIIRNNRFDTVTYYSPILIGWGTYSNIIIENNYIDRKITDPECEVQWNYCWAEMISISRTSNAIVRNNVIKNNPKGEGIDLKASTTYSKIYNNNVEGVSNGPGIYIDSGNTLMNTHHIKVYNNTMRQNAISFGISNENGGTVHDINVYNNIIYDNINGGIRIPIYVEPGTTTGKLYNISLINNIIWDNSIYGIEIGYWPHQLIDNITIRNNIIGKNGDNVRILNNDLTTNLNFEYNIIYGRSSNYGTNYITSNPRFVNPVNGDFHLLSNSTAIDAGISTLAPSVDFEGNPRPEGFRYDIGAFEYSNK